MPNLTASQAAAIETRNAANLKAAKDGAVLKAAYYKPVILVGSTTDEAAGHDKASLEMCFSTNSGYSSEAFRKLVITTPSGNDLFFS